MTPHGNISSPGKLRLLSWYNDSGEECPPHGLIEVRDVEEDTDEGDDLVLIGDKPTTGTTCVAVNMGSPVPAGEYGYCKVEFPAYVAWDTDLGTPGNGETWGPEPDSWLLSYGRPGFTVLGNPVNGVVAVVPVPSATSNRKKFRLVGDLASRLPNYDELNGETDPFNPFSVRAVPQRWADDENVPGDLFPGLGTTGSDLVTGAWVAENFVDFGSSGAPTQQTLYYNSTFIGYLFGNVDEEGNQSDDIPDLADDARGGNGWLVDAEYDEDSGKWFIVGTGTQTIWGTVVFAAGVLGLVSVQEISATGDASYERLLLTSFPGSGVAEGDRVQCTWNPWGAPFSDTIGVWIGIKVSDVSDLTSGCCILIGDDGSINFVATDAAGPGLTTTSDPCKKLTLDLGCGVKFVGNKLTIDTDALTGTGIKAAATGCGFEIDLVEECGIIIAGNVIGIDGDALAGAGLFALDCLLNVGAGDGINVLANTVEVNYGCGLWIVGGALEFDAATVAMEGLTDVDGCGLKLDLDECYFFFSGNKLALDIDELIGGEDALGLEIVTGGEGQCDFIGINAGCYHTFDVTGALTLDLTELIGDDLEIQDDDPCDRITVKWVTDPWTEVTFLTGVDVEVECIDDEMVTTVTEHHSKLKIPSNIPYEVQVID